MSTFFIFQFNTLGSPEFTAGNRVGVVIRVSEVGKTDRKEVHGGKEIQGPDPTEMAYNEIQAGQSGC